MSFTHFFLCFSSEVFAQISCFSSFHLAHALLAVKIPDLFRYSVNFLTPSLLYPRPSIFSPLCYGWNCFLPHCSILSCEWSGKGGGGGGGGLINWGNGQPFYNTWARLSLLRFSSILYQGGEKCMPSIPIGKLFWASNCFPNSV